MRAKTSAVALLLWAAGMTSHGTLLPEQVVESEHLGGSRKVRIYVPPSYALEERKRYPVLYLHDGQNVFSSAGPDCCFGWGSWELDVTADWLIRRGHMREILMVAVDNSRSRYREYRGHLTSGAGASPRRKPTRKGTSPAATRAKSAAAAATAAAEFDNAKFDAYGRFLVEELKPWVDRQYRTLKTPANTGVMGSSLGGIASLALGWEYPKVFGRIACLSGSFQIERRHFLEHVLQAYHGKAKPLRIYLDSGTVDFSGDDDGRAHTEAVANELRRIGWKDGRTLRHYTDLHPLTDEELEKTTLPRHKWGEARSSQHNEFYWKLRSWRALEFMFPAEKKAQ
jgi:predicted alpha/beta superfamily hydrolase